MAFTQTDLDNLDAAIASSELEVTLEGRHVKFDSIDALLKRRAFISGQLAGGAGQSRGSFRFNFTTARGD